jgi:exopolysaccharide biosynthesis polyprenyl glycosylphosphotransferase
VRTDGHLDVEPEPTTPAGRGQAGPDVIAATLLERPSRVGLPEAGPLDQVARRERNYRRGLAVADMIAAAVSVPLAIGIVGGDGLRVWYLILIPLIVLTSKVLGLYDHDELVVRKSTVDEFPRLVSLASTFTLLVWGTRHLTVLGAPGTSAMAALWFALAATLTGCRAISRRVAALVSPVERCLVLGDARAYDRLRLPLADQPGVELVGSVNLARVLVDGTSLAQLAVREEVHRIIIAPDATLRPEDTLELVRRAKETGLRVSLLPGILEAVGSSVVFDDIGGVTLLGVPRFGLTRSSTAIKRAFDGVATSLLLLFALPIIAIAALLIRLDSPGRVFFRQTRVGQDGEHFSMIKLRTMIDGAEALKEGLMALNETHGLFKIADDPRITRVGRWLRRSNLDELPQLINVLRGQMSLVGPRPLVLDEDARVVGSDRRRLHLKPGMTGPWQTLGQRVSLAEMVKVDYLYIANWSLWIDLKILIRTVPHVTGRRGR